MEIENMASSIVKIILLKLVMVRPCSPKIKQEMANGGKKRGQAELGPLLRPADGDERSRPLLRSEAICYMPSAISSYSDHRPLAISHTLLQEPPTLAPDNS